MDEVVRGAAGVRTGTGVVIGVVILLREQLEW